MYDVIVVGAGPVGMSTALILSSAGVRVIVLEAEDELGGQSRASTWHPPTLEMLNCFGVVDNMIAGGLVVDKYQYRSRREGLVAEMDMGLLRDDTKFPFRLQLEQSSFTRGMADELGRRHVPIRYRSKVASVTRDGNAVRAVLADGGMVDGRYLVGADGASSAVRRSLGAEFGGMTYEEMFLTVTSTFPFHEVLSDFAPVNYVADEKDWLVLLRVPTMWRVLVPLYDALAPTDTEARQSISAKLDNVAPGAGQVDRFDWTVYRVHQRVADKFYEDRVALIGDAAHINSPIGGMGMNSGIHDAFEVSMALLDCLGGASDDSLQEAAENRRRFAVDFVQKATSANTSRIKMADDGSQRLATLREIAGDRDRMYAYVRNSSMLDASKNLTTRVLERFGGVRV